ncbi:MAG TPA: PRC-barrel domain-containing protein [Bryobacteraceae bacterium]|nr:PRC-barrel domain-containing protein [Bryobacteraceae bacterium]
MGIASARRSIVHTKELLGLRVRNASGEDLGHIEDITLDLHQGRVAYAVLSFGGLLGLGDKLFAIPWAALTLDQEDNVFILNLDREVLDRAPGFDKHDWPDMTDPEWGSQIFRYYGYRPYWE